MVGDFRIFLAPKSALACAGPLHTQPIAPTSLGKVSAFSDLFVLCPTILSVFLELQICVSQMDCRTTEESRWVHLALTCLLQLFGAQKNSRCDLPNLWPTMSAPVRREEGQVTRFCSLFLILDSGSNVCVRAMSKDARLLPVFASAISIQFFYCMMSTALWSHDCV